MATIVPLDYDIEGAPTICSEVTRDSSRDEEYPIPASELSLPGSPAEITSDWLPGVSPSAKEVAWQLLKIFQRAGHWGTATVTLMSLHMLIDSLRPIGAKVGFMHHPIRADDHHKYIMETFREASRELLRMGYITRDSDERNMSPTPELVRAVTG